MSYENFKAKYEAAFKNMMQYTVGQIGSGVYAEELADLSDAHPEFEARLLAEAATA